MTAIAEPGITRIYIDTETTGLLDFDPDAEIVEIGIVDADGEILFASLVHPKHHDCWPRAEKTHGISPRDVQGAPCFLEIREDIQSIIDAAEEVCAYNALFDTSVLARWGIDFSEKSIIDPMIGFAEWYGGLTGDFKWKRLDVAAAEVGYDLSDAHEAVADARAARAVQVFLEGQAA